VEQLQLENHELRRYLDAQKKVISSLERRAGRSLESLGVHVKQLTTAIHQQAEWQSAVTFVEQEVNGLCDLISDAMLLQKLEAGKVEVHRVPLSLHPVLTSVSRHLLKGDTTVRLICEFEAELPIILADQDLLEAVLTDLLARGLRYSDQDFPVVLGARKEADQAHLYVTAQRFAPLGNRDFATEIVLCCRRIEVQQGMVTCQHSETGLQTVTLTLPIQG
jgi:signal transduction histidine kinase